MGGWLKSYGAFRAKVEEDEALRRVTEASNRALTYVGLGALTVIVGLQIVIFAIWGDAGDPPDAVVAIAFVLFWGGVLTLLGVVILSVRRRLASRRR